MSEGSITPIFFAVAALGSVLKPTSVPYTAGPCTANVGSKLTGEASNASCTVTVDYSDFRFALSVGIRNAVFSGVNVSAQNSIFSFSTMSVTPFVRATASLLSDKKQQANIGKDDIPVVHLQIPIQYTLGFLRVDMPGHRIGVRRFGNTTPYPG